MKIKINSILALVSVLIVSFSCSDNFLEEKRVYGLDDETFYEQPGRVSWYVDNLYNDYFRAYNSPLKSVVGLYNDTRSRLTEEIGGMQSLINPTISYVNASDGDAYYGARLEDKITNNPYTRIRDCNTLLENIDVKGASLDAKFRDEAKGQVYYLRAIQYFDLMRVYGGVPIITTVQTPSIEDPSIKLPRAKVSEVVAQIIADLDAAAALLPPTWNAANYGRFTKGAALAQKSRVLLTFASPLFNKNWDNSTERWDAALAAGLAAETQLTADGFGLFGTNAKQWSEMFLVNNSFCKEAIVVQLLASTSSAVNINNGWEGSIRLTSQGGRGAIEAPKEMIDLFPMANGSRPTTANGYDEFVFFKGRDPRFYRTFAFSGSNWPYTNSLLTAAQPTVWAYRWVDNSNRVYFSGNNNENSPAFVRKMSNPAESNASSFAFSGTDIFEYRYAELLLNIAECYAAKGEIANCLSYLTKIRQRVGITSANNYGIGTLSSKYAAIEACLYERRVELAYEGKRYWDIQRWMLYSNDAPNGIVANTCSKLGLTPLNGTQRTGYYLDYKTKTTSSADPLINARAGISVDPDAPDFSTQMVQLEAFYRNNLVKTELLPPLTPLDHVNNQPVKIDFKTNYYIMGLRQDVLATNPWLEQTIGWNGATASAGTFNYQE
ncbi:RagB/SusD family nutrient uptake outer membrane protein [Flavobacterium pectinovorum]|uniref:RagB/SusD family nutrient uptake outer membrane protein n=1 Tax=Flavobacterium pectinovorum TaxID=29533 RepID=UPI001FACE0B7|nr:RagB/SusD family nutrient uptake outer membrane protein [Flavobacterium pectinovorum]MCI9843710.1 RagB/SusD family nutrient uptake outer membrane protein [Flavobacterium pectinovorum]